MSSCSMPKWWAISWTTVRTTSSSSFARSGQTTSCERLKMTIVSGSSEPGLFYIIAVHCAYKNHDKLPGIVSIITADIKAVPSG